MTSKKSIAKLLFVVFLAAVAWGLQAADLYVTTTADQAADSLREAITIANSNSEDDTIHLPAGLYLLTGTADEDDNLGGDLDIDTAQDISIIGEGVGKTIIDGNQLDRVMHILKGTVSISGVTFQNGKTKNGDVDGEDGGDGGGIYNLGRLSLADCAIINNGCGCGKDGYVTPHGTRCPGSGGDGGGIYNCGKLTLSGCTVENNSAGACGGAIDYCDSSQGGNGGGIYNSSTGTQVLKNCKIIKNKSGYGYDGGWDHDVDNNGGDGGGIYNSGSQNLLHCTISYNSTGRSGVGTYGSVGKDGRGGGIFNSGNSTIAACIIRQNTLGGYHPPEPEDYGHPGLGDGAGIYNSGALSLTDSTIDSNQTGKGGRGGGIFHLQNTFSITRCSITNNKTGNFSSWYGRTGNEAGGGGIFNESTMTITNCTLSNNKTGDGAGTEYYWQDQAENGGDGAGIYNNGSSSTITLINTTLCHNTTGKGGICLVPGPEPGRGGCGGGFYNLLGTIHFKNTIVANNAIAAGGEGADGWGTLNSQGYNLIEDTAHCTMTGILTGNITGVDPLLSPLADNGGPTQTHALLQGSPAIDAGYSPGISLDQRGYTRPVDIPGIANVNDGSDIGAFEFDTPTTTISGQVTHGEIGLPGVIMTFSNQGGTATTDAQGHYSQAIPYHWTGTVTPSLSNYIFTPASRSYTNVTASKPGQDYSAVTLLPPRIVPDRPELYFGADTQGHQTGMQTLVITNGGGGILSWTISDNAPWLNCTPTSGTGPAAISVTVEPTGLSAGTYTAAISIEATGAVNSPQTVQVTLTVYSAGADNPPFGSFDTPLEGSTVSGSIPVTGWVIDNLGVESVKIFRSPVEGEGSGWIYIGDAVRIEGARPDIEALYPEYPGSYKAGWGYMMLTNFLPNQGNGIFTLYAQAADIEGNTVILGSKTITCDNAHAVRPFGAIDTPAQGGTATGSHYLNYGWVLTPPPNTIPIDGSTIQVWVDGVALGNPVYNQNREDVAALFPGYNNSNGAGGCFTLDTTRYENGVHTIFWTAVDNAGNIDGIGSRYFTIQNLAGTSAVSATEDNYKKFLEVQKPFYQKGFWPPEALVFQKGYNPGSEPEVLSPGENGQYKIEIKELERVVIYLEDLETESASGEYKKQTEPHNGFIEKDSGEPGVHPIVSNSHLTLNTQHLTLKNTPSRQYEGYLVNGDEIKPLPIGSTFDHSRGVFYWQPGPGFLGEYRLVFIKTDREGNISGKEVQVNIIPKF